MSDWTAFFGAEVAAAAALAGLVFVGVSINLEKIVGTPGLPGRAAEAIIVLLVVDRRLIAPGAGTTYGVRRHRIAGGGSGRLGGPDNHPAGCFPRLGPQHRGPFVVCVVLGQGASLPFVVAGIAVLLRGTGGIYWTVPGVVCSFGLAFMAAWSLLIEINR